MSALYSGVVHHARIGQRSHRLRYRIFMLLLDLDRPTAPRLLGLDRAGLISVWARDHLDGTGAPLRPQVEALVRRAGLPVPDGPIRLLTMPRVLGRGFNPLSLYYCHAADGTLRAVVYEVNNTFGGRHTYVLPAERQRCAKAFFVSPFMDGDLTYDFAVEAPGEAARIGIAVSRGDETLLTASFTGTRRPLTSASLLRAWAGHPLQTVGVLAGIYLEAVKMLAKGFRWRSPRRVQAEAGPAEVV